MGHGALWDPIQWKWIYQWQPCAHDGKFVTLDAVSRIEVRLEGETTYVRLWSTGWWNGTGDPPKEVLDALASEEIRVDGDHLHVWMWTGPGDEQLRVGAGGIDADGDGKLNLMTASKPDFVGINASGGNDAIDARSSDARRFTGNGGDGNDAIYGTGRDDGLFGHEGIDVLVGGSGHDTMQGDAGDDQLSGNDGDDHLTGWAGHDPLSAGPGGSDHCDVDQSDPAPMSCEVITEVIVLDPRAAAWRRHHQAGQPSGTISHCEAMRNTSVAAERVGDGEAGGVEADDEPGLDLAEPTGEQRDAADELARREHGEQTAPWHGGADGHEGRGEAGEVEEPAEQLEGDRRGEGAGADPDGGEAPDDRGRLRRHVAGRPAPEPAATRMPHAIGRMRTVGRCSTNAAAATNATVAASGPSTAHVPLGEAAQRPTRPRTASTTGVITPFTNSAHAAPPVSVPARRYSRKEYAVATAPPAGTDAAMAPLANVSATMSPAPIRPPATRSRTRRTPANSPMLASAAAAVAATHGHRTSSSWRTAAARSSRASSMRNASTATTSAGASRRRAVGPSRPPRGSSTCVAIMRSQRDQPRALPHRAVTGPVCRGAGSVSG